jgi:glyoxylase-like metal-dependent hydrolase (beta-lactamase superfamily II)
MISHPPFTGPPRIQHHPDEVFSVDAEFLRPGLAAVHVIRHRGRALVVDTGTNASVPLLLAALEALAIAPAQVEGVFLTHVHLDHAGGAGALMRELPAARLFVHPRGERHMRDPAKLVGASIAVYGEERFTRLYGEIVPVPAERIVSMADGFQFDLAGRAFEVAHTPGHAAHHCILVDRMHRAVFAGDTFGVSYRELDTAAGAFIVPSTTPAQFDPAELHRSIDRVMSYSPDSVYLTHYSRVTDVQRLAGLLHTQIDAFVRIAAAHAGERAALEAIGADMLRLWLELLRTHGSALDPHAVRALLGLDLELNAAGLVAWLERANKLPA